MPNREAKTMEDTIVKALKVYPSELVKTITCDRGKEFSNWENIEKRLKMWDWSSGLRRSLRSVVLYPNIRIQT